MPGPQPPQRRARSGSTLSTASSLSFSSTGNFDRISQSDVSGFDDVVTGERGFATHQTSASSSSSAFLRKSVSIPTSLVLQALFVLSMAVIAIAACALYSSFVNGVRGNVGDTLIEQLSLCTANRLGRVMTRCELLMLSWQRDLYSRQQLSLASVAGGSDSAAANATSSSLSPIHFAALWQSTIQFMWDRNAQMTKRCKHRRGAACYRGSVLDVPSSIELTWRLLLPRDDGQLLNRSASGRNRLESQLPRDDTINPLLSSCGDAFSLSVHYACDPANVSSLVATTTTRNTSSTSAAGLLCPNAGLGVVFVAITAAKDDSSASADRTTTGGITAQMISLDMHLATDLAATISDEVLMAANTDGGAGGSAMTTAAEVMRIFVSTLNTTTDNDIGSRRYSLETLLFNSTRELLKHLDQRGFRTEASCLSIMHTVTAAVAATTNTTTTGIGADASAAAVSSLIDALLLTDETSKLMAQVDATWSSAAATTTTAADSSQSLAASWWTTSTANMFAKFATEVQYLELLNNNSNSVGSTLSEGFDRWTLFRAAGSGWGILRDGPVAMHAANLSSTHADWWRPRLLGLSRAQLLWATTAATTGTAPVVRFLPLVLTTVLEPVQDLPSSFLVDNTKQQQQQRTTQGGHWSVGGSSTNQSSSIGGASSTVFCTPGQDNTLIGATSTMWTSSAEVTLPASSLMSVEALQAWANAGQPNIFTMSSGLVAVQGMSATTSIENSVTLAVDDTNTNNTSSINTAAGTSYASSVSSGSGLWVVVDSLRPFLSWWWWPQNKSSNATTLDTFVQRVVNPDIVARRLMRTVALTSAELDALTQSGGYSTPAPSGVFRSTTTPSPYGPDGDLTIDTNAMAPPSHKDLGTDALAQLVVVSTSMGDASLDDGNVAEGVQLMNILAAGITLALMTIGSFFIQALALRIVRLAEDFAHAELFDVAEDVVQDHLNIDVGGGGDNSRVGGLKSISHFATKLKQNAIASVRKISGRGGGDGGSRSSGRRSSSVTVSSIQGSMFREVDGVCKGLRMIVRHILTLKRFAPSTSMSPSPLQLVRHGDGAADDAIQRRGDEKVAADDDEDDEAGGAQSEMSVIVAVRYESRSTSLEFSRAEFVFSFDPDEVMGGGDGGDANHAGGGRGGHSAAADDESTAISASQHHQRKTLYSRLVAACVEHCREDPFQLVTLTYVSPNNEHVVLRSSLQVLEVLSVMAAATTAAAPSSPLLSPRAGGTASSKFVDDGSGGGGSGETSFESSAGQSLLRRSGTTLLRSGGGGGDAAGGGDVSSSGVVRLTMHKTTIPKVIVPFTIFVDVFNLFSTIVFVIQLAGSGDDGTSSQSIIAFCCLYSFALTTNFILCLVFIRQLMSRDHTFSAWAERRSLELRICTFCSALNLQNLELMWCGIRIDTPKWWRTPTSSSSTATSTFTSSSPSLLFFNAPPNDDAIFKSIQWSILGFLFSDVTQLIFKAWVIVSSKVVQVETILALVSSTISVMFNVAVKLHATFLWTRAVESSVLFFGGLRRGGADSFGVEGDDLDGVAPAALASTATLTQRDCSVVFVRMRNPDDVHQLSLLAVEWGQCYEAVLACARAAKATVLQVNSGMVLLAINATRSHSGASLQRDHESAAIHLSMQIKSALEKSAPTWSVALVIHSGVFLTGVLGSFHKKSTHVILTSSTTTSTTPTSPPSTAGGTPQLLKRGVVAATSGTTTTSCVTGGSQLELLARVGLLFVQHQSSRVVVMVTGNVVRNALGGTELSQLMPGEPLETSEYVGGGHALMLMRPAQLFASLRGGGSKQQTPSEGRSNSSSSSSSSVVVAWPEFAFLYRSDDARPAVVDSRTRFLTVAFGWQELNMERLKIGLSRLFEHGWNYRGPAIASSSLGGDGGGASGRVGFAHRIATRRSPRRRVNGGTDSATEEEGDSEDDPNARSGDEMAGGSTRSRSPAAPSSSASHRHTPTRRRGGGGTGSGGPVVVVSPRKLFGML